MRIAETADPGSDWDAFVETTPGGRLGHAAAWAHVMREAYGLTPCYLEARDDSGALTGVLPLVRFRRLTGGLELVSMPFLDTGGVLASTSDIAEALREQACDRARELGATAVELRETAPGSDDPSQSRVDLVLALEGDEDAQWSAFRANVRNQTRKAEKEGLSLVEAGDRGLLAGFYEPFCVNMRDLGSPVHGERFFAAAAEAFGERWRFVVTHLGNRSVGGLAAIDFAGAVTVPWASTLRSERRRCPNNQIYWEAIRWAIARGAREFDFGRSPRDAGTYRFKVGWGAVERALAWKRLDPSGRDLPLQSAADSPLLRRLTTVWRRMPVAWTSVLGPVIRRRISS